MEPHTAAPAWTFRTHWMSQVAGHAVMRPDATALRYLGADTTWRELHERSLSFAGALRARGVAQGDRVLLLTLNRPEVVEAVFGINTLGAIAVPVNVRLAPPELAHIAVDSGATTIVTERLLAPLATALAAMVPTLARRIVIDGPPDDGAESYEELVASTSAFAPPDVHEDAVALIMYTSGTTGKPKGACLSHRNLLMQALTCIRANDIGDESDIAFCTSPFFHIAGFGSIAANFLLGIPTVIHPLGAFDPAAVVDAWERERATVVFNVPQQWQAICALPGIKERDLAPRIISWGAAPASESLLRTMAETFPAATNVAVFGQTETSPITCVLRGEDSLRKIGSVGRPIPTIQYRVVDADMNDVGPGEVGEIVYRGPTVMTGYWNAPEATAEAFRGGWFHSGDLVRQDDEGFVWVVDRTKDMIISGGENIYSVEIENALAAHPKILEVAVVGRADDTWGEVPVAFVTPSPGHDFTLDDLQSFLHDVVARYKWPKDVVVVEALPRNAVGKVLKPTLRDRLAAATA